jgi:hypothetical protein
MCRLCANVLREAAKGNRGCGTSLINPGGKLDHTGAALVMARLGTA